MDSQNPENDLNHTMPNTIGNNKFETGQTNSFSNQEKNLFIKQHFKVIIFVVIVIILAIIITLAKLSSTNAISESSLKSVYSKTGLSQPISSSYKYYCEMPNIGPYECQGNFEVYLPSNGDNCSTLQQIESTLQNGGWDVTATQASCSNTGEIFSPDKKYVMECGNNNSQSTYSSSQIECTLIGTENKLL